MNRVSESDTDSLSGTPNDATGPRRQRIVEPSGTAGTTGSPALLSPPERAILGLQRTAGNSAVSALLANRPQATGRHLELPSATAQGNRVGAPSLDHRGFGHPALVAQTAATHGSGGTVQRQAAVAESGLAEAATRAALTSLAMEETKRAIAEAEEAAARNRLGEPQRALLSTGVIGPLHSILRRMDRIPIKASIDLLETPFATLEAIDGPEGAMDTIFFAGFNLSSARVSLMAADDPGGTKGRVVRGMAEAGGELAGIAQAAKQSTSEHPGPSGGPAPAMTPAATSLLEGYAARLRSQSARIASVTDSDELAAIGDDVLAIATTLASIDAPAAIRPQLLGVVDRCVLQSNAIDGLAGGREVAMANARDQIGSAIASLEPLAGLEPAAAPAAVEGP